MKEMEALAFTDKSTSPNEEQVAYALADNRFLLEEFLSEAGIEQKAWKFYGATSGWTMQCKRSNKSLCYIQIADKCFYVTIVLSRQAKIKALEEIADESIQQAILQAKDYEEGTSVRLLVKEKKDISAIMELLAIKNQPIT